jgi:hypothetical protein
MEYNLIKDKLIALVVWNTEKENDVHVYLGEIEKRENDYRFLNTKKKWNIPLQPEKLHEIKVVTEDLKGTLLNADFFLNLRIANISDDSMDDYISTGMKWHS